MNASIGSDRLLNFIQFLRARDVAVSPADSLDAIHVASLLGYDDRQQLAQGLAAVLAKSRQDRIAFDVAFEQFFSVDVGQDNTQESEAVDRADARGDTDTHDLRAAQNIEDENRSASPLDTLAANDAQVAELLKSPLVQDLRDGQEANLALAIEQAAAKAQLETMQRFTQRGQFMRAMLDAVGELPLRQAAARLEHTEPEAFDELQQIREQLRSRIRNRIERGYLLHAQGATERFLDEALEQVRLSNVSPYQQARMRKLIERMARKLASRHGRRRRKTRRGQLNIPKTLRTANATDGIPFVPQWRQIERRKPQIMAICDVSGSVAAYAKFLLMFLYALQDVLPRTRSFAFSSQLGEVTEWFEQLPIDSAINQVNLSYGGATDYGRAFQDFSELALNDINSGTTVIILGDGRNNDCDPRLDLLAQIHSRCRRLIWLNPETRRAWGTGDSAMPGIIKHCHIATECNNLKQLQRIVDKLLADTRSH